MRQSRSKKPARPVDEQLVTFALRLEDPQQLRIYAWLKTLGKRNGVFQFTAKLLINQYLDSIGFSPTKEELDALRIERGLAVAVPTRAPTVSRTPSPALSLSSEDDDEFTM